MYYIGKNYALESNDKLALAFDKILNNIDFSQMSEKDFAELLRDKYAEKMKEWYESPNNILDNGNLVDYVQNLSEQDLLDFSFGFISQFDFDLPDFMQIKLKNISTKNRDLILNKLLTISAEKRDQYHEYEDGLSEIYTANRLLAILALWNSTDYARKILTWFLSVNVPDDRLADAVVFYFEKNDLHANKELIECLNEILDSDNREKVQTKYLLQALTNFTKKFSALSYSGAAEDLKDESYKILRKAFRNLKEKNFVVLCLGDLAYARAIPLLRTYVEEHESTIEEQLYYDIVSSLKRLGANLEDFPDPSLRFALERKNRVNRNSL